MTEQTNDETGLILLNEADKALALAQSVPELKNLRSAFTIAKAWAKTRGLGVNAENKAAEYILRTERKIGKELIRMLEAGELRGREEPGPGRGHKRSPDSGDLLGDTLPVSGLGIADLGIAHQRASEWQRVAVLSEDAFEALLAHAREARERLAKVNFYLFDAEPADHERPTPPKPGFDMFRAGAYTLLGWRVNDEGVGGPTTNGLLTLPNDELLQLANIVKALIPAYNEAKKARE